MTATAPQTKTRGNWPGKPPRVHTAANIDAIVKTRAPYTGTRVTAGSKWDHVFQGAREGDCFECPPEETARVERALRMWLKKYGIEGIVRRQSKSEDGKGRVWLLKVLKPKGGAA